MQPLRRVSAAGEPVPRGEVVVGTEHLNGTVLGVWGTHRAPTRGSASAFINASEALGSFGGGNQSTAHEEAINPICRGGWD